MKKYLKLLSSKKSMKFIDGVHDFFKRFPHLPKSWTKFIAKVMPWLALIGGVGSVMSGLNLLSKRRMGFGYYGWMREFMQINPVYFALSGLLTILTGILLLIAFKYLKDKKEMGWLLIFYSSLVGIADNFLAVFFAYDGVFGLVLSALISLWLTFELRDEFLK